MARSILQLTSRRLFLGTLSALAVAITASCDAAKSGHPSTSEESSLPPATTTLIGEQAMPLQLLIEQNSNVQTAIDIRVGSAIQDCMEAQGFDYALREAPSQVNVDLRSRYGLSDLERARSLGYYPPPYDDS